MIKDKETFEASTQISAVELPFLQDENSKYFRGDFVFSLNKPEWGIAQVLSVSKKKFQISFLLDNREEEFTNLNNFIRLKAFPKILSKLNKASVKPEFWNLTRQAFKLKFAYTYEKLNSLSNSRTRLLAHQIEAAERALQPVRSRFLLADEVGLGKTVEAGLIMKELIFRRACHSVLILTPSSLCKQWQSEMKMKFNEDFFIVDGSEIGKVKRKEIRRLKLKGIKIPEAVNNDEEVNGPSLSASIWQDNPRIISSIDLAKNPNYLPDIISRKWDIVIIDEAHRLRRDSHSITLAWQLAYALSQKCENFLLLSATPFRGKLEELYYLISLLDPDIAGPLSSFLSRYDTNSSSLREKIAPIVIRRRKIEVGGFTARFAKTIRLTLSPEERIFYDETTSYVRHQYDMANRDGRVAIGFVMIVFQRLLDSSSKALMNALKRRLFKLEGAFQKLTNLKNEYSKFDFSELEDDDAEDWEQNLDEIFAMEEENSLQEMRQEIMSLKNLIRLGSKIKQDKKLTALLDLLKKMKKNGTKKFLIFTEFRTTQDYIAEALEQNFTVDVFHGSLNRNEKEKSIDRFKAETDVLICTEAGGEGRNLQWCNILINYDLPWSPLKVEQRIGRLHRFGQAKDVKIINFSTRDTVSERVLEVLQNKIKLFEDALGESDTLLGILESEVNFSRSFASFISSRKSTREVNREIEDGIEKAKLGYEKLNNLVSPKLMDFSLEDYYSTTSEDRNIANQDIENFILSCQKEQGELEGSVKLKKLEKDIYTIQENTQNSKSKNIKLENNSKEKKGTFKANLALDNEALDFFAFGHSIVDNEILKYTGNFTSLYCQAYLKKNSKHPEHLLVDELGLPIMYWHIICSVSFSYLPGYKELMETTFSLHDYKEVSEPLFGQKTSNFFQTKTNQKNIFLSDEDRMRNTLNYNIIFSKLYKRAAKKAEKLFSNLQPEMKREEIQMEESISDRLQELESKLDIAKAKSKWYGEKDYKSVITRLENKKTKIYKERKKKLESFCLSNSSSFDIDVISILKFSYK